MRCPGDGLWPEAGLDGQLERPPQPGIGFDEVEYAVHLDQFHHDETEEPHRPEAANQALLAAGIRTLAQAGSQHRLAVGLLQQVLLVTHRRLAGAREEGQEVVAAPVQVTLEEIVVDHIAGEEGLERLFGENEFRIELAAAPRRHFMEGFGDHRKITGGHPVDTRRKGHAGPGHELQKAGLVRNSLVERLVDQGYFQASCFERLTLIEHESNDRLRSRQEDQPLARMKCLDPRERRQHVVDVEPVHAADRFDPPDEAGLAHGVRPRPGDQGTGNPAPPEVTADGNHGALVGAGEDDIADAMDHRLRLARHRGRLR
ncbi:hypothetical protein FQZ97_460840 [compost metagenome]